LHNLHKYSYHGRRYKKQKYFSEFVAKPQKYHRAMIARGTKIFHANYRNNPG